LTFSCIVSTHGELLECEEWEIIFNSIQQILTNYVKSFGLQKGIIECFQKIFNVIRNLFIIGKYYGPIKELCECYYNVKEIIMDLQFDTLFINKILFLNDYSNEELLKQYQDFLCFEKIIKNLTQENSDMRIHNLLNCYNDFYENMLIAKNMNLFPDIEKSFIIKITETKTLNFSQSNNLQIIQILYKIASKTYFDDNFNSVALLLENEILLPRENRNVKTRNSENLIIDESLKCLFLLFNQYYLQTAFPTRLLSIIKVFLNILRSNLKEIVMLVLQFFAQIEFDQNYDLRMKTYEISTNLNIFGNPAECFKPQQIIDNVMNLFNPRAEKEIAICGIDTLKYIFGCHYSIYGCEIQKSIDNIIHYENYAIRQGNYEIALKLEELFEIIGLQNNILIDNQKEHLTIFMNCVSKMSQLSGIYKSLYEKSKQSNKIWSLPSVLTTIEDPNEKTETKKLIILLKTVLSNISSLLFTANQNSNLEIVKTLIPILKSFVGDEVLLEIFADELQKIIANIVSARIINNKWQDIIVAFLDIILQIGWHNLLNINNSIFF